MDVIGIVVDVICQSVKIRLDFGRGVPDGVIQCQQECRQSVASCSYARKGIAEGCIRIGCQHQRRRNKPDAFGDGVGGCGEDRQIAMRVCERRWFDRIAPIGHVFTDAGGFQRNGDDLFELVVHKIGASRWCDEIMLNHFFA